MSLDRMKEIRNFIKIANEESSKFCDSENYHKGIYDITLMSLRCIDYLIENEKRSYDEN